MNKYTAIVAILSLFMLLSFVLTPIAFAAPPIKRPMDLYETTIQGEAPATVDYAVAFDTASGEIIHNMMDTLIIFNGEHTDQYLPSIATSWASTPLGPGGAGVDSGLPISGLSFENPANQSGVNATYYYQYDFKIRTGVAFQPPYNYSLTPEDVVFSFQRTMIMDTAGGPQWMLQEPLLDNAAGDNASAGGIADLTNQTQVAELGALIQNAVQCNTTDVWFNLMFPSAYPPFMQILTQTCSSIESIQWIQNQVCTDPARAPYEWNGTWPDTTSWLTFYNPAIANYPLDNPTPIMYGSGPFIITTVDYNNSLWAGVRNELYWRGWPADFPAVSGTTPAGFVNTIHVSWAFDWPTRKSMFLAGDCDFCDVPSQNIADVYQSSTPPYDPPNYPVAGIRCIHPLPELEVDGFFFTFDISTSAYGGQINAPGVFSPSGIPSDFFGNPTWGIYIRKAFACAFNYAQLISSAFLGEASQPATAIIPGLVDYDPSVAGYQYNLTQAEMYFQQAAAAGAGVLSQGFNITLVYTAGNTEMQMACLLLQSALTTIASALNTAFTVNVVGIPWPTYLNDATCQELPCFAIGWQAGFSDPDDFAFPFYHTGGAFASWQMYSNATMDALIDQGIATSEGPARAAIYSSIEKLAVADCPSFTISQPIGRHFERDWVVGWYYNPLYPGEYFYNLWKWYYLPESLLSQPQDPQSYNLPIDVNYDGKIDIKDFAIVARAESSSYGPPISPRWNFRADINNDRKIDMRDIGAFRSFGEVSPTWGPSVSISPSMASLNVGQSVIFTSTVTQGTPPYAYQWYENNASIAGATSPTYAFTSQSVGICNFVLMVTDNASKTTKSETASIYTGVPSPQIRMSVYPYTLNILPGDTITVNVTVPYAVTNLYTWQVCLEYNASIINCSAMWIPVNNVFQGQSPVTSAGGVNTNAPTADGLNYTFMGATLAPGLSGVNVSSGTLFDVNFTAIESGETPIRIGTVGNPVLDPTGVQWYSYMLDSGLNEMPFYADNGNVIVAQGPSSTSVTCSPTSAAVGSAVNCTAVVSGLSPTGTVTWSTNSSTGSFSSYTSTLSSGSCSTTYTDNNTGYFNITATYSGDLNNAPSSGSTTLTVFMNVATGTNVTIYPTNDVDLTFANVTSPGYVIVDEISAVRAPPLNNTVGPFFEFIITAGYSGNVTVSLAYGSWNMTPQQATTLEMWSYTRLIGDIRLPYGIINMADIGYIAKHYGTNNVTKGPVPWDPDCDIYGPQRIPDGIVNMYDLGFVARHFLETSAWIPITLSVDTTNQVIYGLAPPGFTDISMTIP
jgi:peptide/nickel transport system substrate-binding protein